MLRTHTHTEFICNTSKQGNYNVRHRTRHGGIPGNPLHKRVPYIHTYITYISITFIIAQFAIIENGVVACSVASSHLAPRTSHQFIIAKNVLNLGTFVKGERERESLSQRVMRESLISSWRVLVREYI